MPINPITGSQSVKLRTTSCSLSVNFLKGIKMAEKFNTNIRCVKCSHEFKKELSADDIVSEVTCPKCLKTGHVEINFGKLNWGFDNGTISRFFL